MERPMTTGVLSDKRFVSDAVKSYDDTAAVRLKILLENAVGMYAEAHSDRYNSREEFAESVYDGLGTDRAELDMLGVDMTDIL